MPLTVLHTSMTLVDLPEGESLLEFCEWYIGFLTSLVEDAEAFVRGLDDAQRS